MLKIRLQRIGRKNDPSFRVVVTDSKNGPKSGKFLEVVGSYDARKGEPVLQGERIKHWLSVGAQASGTIHNLLISQKIIDGKKVNVLPLRRQIKKDEPKEAEVPKAEVTETEKPAETEVAKEENKEEKTPEVKTETEPSKDEIAAPVAEKEEEKKEEGEVEKEPA